MSNLANAAGSGRPHTAKTPDTNTGLERMIRGNRRTTIDLNRTRELKIGRGSAHHISHEVLQYWNVSARWVQKQFTPHLKECHEDFMDSFTEFWSWKRWFSFLFSLVLTNHFDREPDKASHRETKNTWQISCPRQRHESLRWKEATETFVVLITVTIHLWTIWHLTSRHFFLL